MLLIGFLIGVAVALTAVYNPVDVTNYWGAGTSSRLYPEHWSEYLPGYLFYPPPVAQLSTLLQPLGWQLFVVLMLTLTFGAMWYCVREWSFLLLLLGVPHYLNIGPPEFAVFLDYALLGNLQWVLAALVLAAIDRPPIWALMLVTKVTTAIGWWWYVVRGEWRKAFVAAAVSIAVIAVSVVTAPQQWVEFAGFVARNFTMANPPQTAFFIPIGIRLPTALLLVIWGARTNRRWAVPVAVGWALPAVFLSAFPIYWAAAAVAWRDGRLRSPASS
jgi:hypothetical protein